MKKTFGTNSALLTINSLPLDQPSTEGGGRTFLSQDDHDGLRKFMEDLIYKHVLNHMENKLRTLEEHVGANRKSLFTSKVRSFFRFQPRPRQTGEQGAPELTSTGVRIYAMNSNIAQTRQLADFAFMLRDYDSALLNYKNAAVDMKSDQTTRYVAAVMEMSALCSSIIDTQRRDSEMEMEKAQSL